MLDATDNFETRYLLNDVCVKYSRPWIYSGVIASYGVTMNIVPGDTPCLRCVFPEMPLPGTTPTCDTAGVLNGIVGAISGVASTEALKILLKSEKMSRAMFWMDVWENTCERIELPQDHFYEWELAGCRVETLDGKVIGLVREVMHTGGVEILEQCFRRFAIFEDIVEAASRLGHDFDRTGLEQFVGLDVDVAVGDGQSLLAP